MEWILPVIVLVGLGCVVVGLATSKGRRSGDSDIGGIAPHAQYGGDDGGGGD